MIILLTFLLLQHSLSQQGAEAMRSGRFADAERIYRQMIEEMPTEPKLRMNLALALHSGGKYHEAIGEFEAFLKASPAPGPAHLLLGVARLKLRQPCEAIAPLETAAKWQKSPQVLIELGDAFFGCQRYGDAAATFSALDRNPKALQGAGLSYARLGRADLARNAFEKLEAMGPSPELRELEAEVFTLEGRYDDAVRALEDARRLAPPDARIQRLLARALWRAGRYDDAAKLYAALAPRWEHDPEFLFERGDTLVRTEGPEAGMPLLERAVREAPQLLPARGALGRALIQVGRAAEATPHLEAAAPEDATLLLPLSRAYRAAGRTEDAARTEAEYRKRVVDQP